MFLKLHADGAHPQTHGAAEATGQHHDASSLHGPPPEPSTIGARTDGIQRANATKAQTGSAPESGRQAACRQVKSCEAAQGPEVSGPLHAGARPADLRLDRRGRHVRESLRRCRACRSSARFGTGNAARGVRRRDGAGSRAPCRGAFRDPRRAGRGYSKRQARAERRQSRLRDGEIPDPTRWAAPVWRIKPVAVDVKVGVGIQGGQVDTAQWIQGVLAGADRTNVVPLLPPRKEPAE